MTRITAQVIDKINQDYIVIPKNKTIDVAKKHTVADFLNLVLRFTAEHYCLTLDEIRGEDRHYPRPLARQVYFYLCAEYKPMDCSTVAVGAFVNKSHSMAVNMPDKIKDMMSVDKNFRAEMEEVITKFKTKISL